MKMLLVRSTGGISGAEVYTEILAQALKKQKVIVGILTNYLPWQKRLRKNFIFSSYINFPVPETGTFRSLVLAAVYFFYMIPAYLQKVREMEKGRKYDSIVLESMTEKLFLSPYLKLLGYRVIWIEHGPLFVTNRNILVKKLYAWKSRWPDKIIAVSRDTQNDLKRGGVNAQKLCAVYIGVKPGVYKDNKRKKFLTIGFLGSVCREKGIEVFLDVATTLKEKKVSFLVIGDGPMFVWAKSKVKERGLEKQITFTGFVSDPDPYIKKIDILFFPTNHYEGLSIALLYCLKEGKLVVASDMGGNRELVIDNKTGYLYPLRVAPLKVVAQSIRSYRKSVDIRNIRKKAIEHIRKNFNIHTQIHKFIQVFQP